MWVENLKQVRDPLTDPIALRNNGIVGRSMAGLLMRLLFVCFFCSYKKKKKKKKKKIFGALAGLLPVAVAFSGI